ncbi:pyridoxamine 5'-phosphate oxidase family protein [Gammaproteobacteria bacterium]|nr:pyridoxamine 5'-phosphate oxidase family protein [Gammaproteobacteria bacterium]
MIKISNLSNEEPYLYFNDLYKEAKLKNQDSIEAIAISSFNKLSNEVESRYVNLKYIDGDKWIFFSNYESLKAQNFSLHNQISALFFWSTLNVQIRLKANIYKTDIKFSDQHFKKRSKEKNALAISSNQSKISSSYQEIKNEYSSALNKISPLTDRPEYWGGFTFTPYYFEFWQGHESRINRRDIFERHNGNWNKSILQP